MLYSTCNIICTNNIYRLSTVHTVTVFLHGLRRTCYSIFSKLPFTISTVLLLLTAPRWNDRFQPTNNAHSTDLLLYFTNSTPYSNALIATPVSTALIATPDSNALIFTNNNSHRTEERKRFTRTTEPTERSPIRVEYCIRRQNTKT